MAHKSLKVFGENIRALRAKRNWDQAALAGQVKVAIKTISLIEGGKTATRLDLIGKLADAFGLSVAQILTDPTQSQIKPNVIEHGIQECAARVGKFVAGFASLPEDERALLEATIAQADHSPKVSEEEAG